MEEIVIFKRAVRLGAPLAHNPEERMGDAASTRLTPHPRGTMYIAARAPSPTQAPISQTRHRWSVATLVFLATTARARLIPSDLRHPILQFRRTARPKSRPL